MKKFLSIFALTFIISVSAQNTLPRFGTNPQRQDNTGRTLSWAVVTTTDVTSATLDTILLQPNNWETIVCMRTGTVMTNLADSVCYKFSSSNTRYQAGDICTFMVQKGAGAGKIKFGGSQFITSTASAAVLLAANKSLIMRFRWNGVKWIEETRVVQP